ncbi:hypothetical protein DFR69_106100 [Nocardia neocaledoniensis]|uniref:Diacylglycerol O-acyltransferase n=1 Tax=Nocardia neocaledoniensis TaxID=236511 RepID=A0A317NGH6_9NOCA|nr:hypothetical protein [Nocardia neocaledoniensis]PWV74289.1 hypothetical protein DFR69_106100 [Nocardia neocaledoniensis]
MTVTSPAVAAAPTALNRITADDDLFFKLHSLYPNALVNQLAYRFDERLDPDLLRRWHEHLAAGFIARRVRTTRFPIARAHWEPATESMPLIWSATELADEDVLSWFLARAAVEFDPERGLVWQLAGAHTASGGTVVTLVASHVVCDGGGMMHAIVDSLDRLNRGEAPDRHAGAGRLVGPVAGAGRFAADLADARGQLRAVARGVRAARRARGVSEPARNPRPAEPRLPHAETWQAAETIVQLDLADWDAVAAAHGGTTNGLLIGVAVGLLGRSGRVADGAEVRVDIPHSMRVADDPRANATTGLPIAVTYRAGERADLPAIRAALKAAGLAYRDPATIPPIQHLQPVQMLLPRAVLHRFARTAKAPECLCTNMGRTAQNIADLGPHRARDVIMRPVVNPGPVELFRQVEVGVNLAFSCDDTTVTLVVTGGDPDRFPTRAALQQLLSAEFADWGLSPRFW